MVKVELVTTEDLNVLKKELLEEIARLLQGRQPQGTDKKWLKSREVRALLHISPGKLHQLRVSKKLPFTRLGGVIYYAQEDIEQMIKKYKSGNV